MDRSIAASRSIAGSSRSITAVPESTTAETSALWSSRYCWAANEPKLWAMSASGSPGWASTATALIRPMSATSSPQPSSPSTPYSSVEVAVLPCPRWSSA
jgi:hypothetical protein